MSSGTHTTNPGGRWQSRSTRSFLWSLSGRISEWVVCLLMLVETHTLSCSGTVEFTGFPSLEGVVPTPQVLQIPNMYAREGTGSVCTMEWSSDGYVLAVGWEKGWAVWSVGGRCLAWGFGVEYEVDEERFTDAFMYGVRSLVSVSFTGYSLRMTERGLVLGVGELRARHASTELD